VGNWSKGDRVIATKDIGGWRENVPKGSYGVIVDPGGWSSNTTVEFTVNGGFFDDRQVSVTVEDGEIELGPR
jgi:hypothetical protein